MKTSELEVADSSSGSKNERRRRMLIGSTTTAGATAALAAVFAGLCCVGPVTVVLLGAGGAVAAAGLKPYRLPLLVVSAVLVLGGFWRTYWAVGAGQGQSCPGQVGRWVHRALFGAAVVWIVAATLFLVE